MQYIIMQDKHPIDELFRQGLERASVAPPSNVWTTIQRERGRDRNDWWWIGGAGAILIGLGLAVWPGQEPSTTRDPETSAQTVRPFAQEAAPSAWSPAHLASVDVPMDTEKPRHVEDDRGEDLAETGSEGAHPNAEMPVVVGTRTRLSLAGTGTHGVLECGGTSRPFNQEIDGAELSKFVLEELALLPPALEHVEGAPGAATPSGYLLDPGEFWIAAELGVFRLDGRHASKDAALDAARDRSLSPGMEVGGGL
ncbi:MAG: hypothetical protein KDB88_06645, partial [Flavobacteriales bacterium]|nr:hypothetical protein [Flavobacteriales bacterium]